VGTRIGFAGRPVVRGHSASVSRRLTRCGFRNRGPNVGPESRGLPGRCWSSTCVATRESRISPQSMDNSRAILIRVVERPRLGSFGSRTFAESTPRCSTPPRRSESVRWEARRVGRPRKFVAREVSAGDEVSVMVSAIRNRDTDGQLIVLLGPQRRSGLRRTDAAPADGFWRIFGEVFRKKALIRKNTPWVILDRSGEGVSEGRFENVIARNCGQPPPCPLTCSSSDQCLTFFARFCLFSKIASAARIGFAHRARRVGFGVFPPAQSRPARNSWIRSLFLFFTCFHRIFLVYMSLRG